MVGVTESTAIGVSNMNHFGIMLVQLVLHWAMMRVFIVIMLKDGTSGIQADDAIHQRSPVLSTILFASKPAHMSTQTVTYAEGLDPLLGLGHHVLGQLTNHGANDHCIWSSLAIISCRIG